MARSCSGNAFSDLGIGVYRIERGFAFGRVFDRQRESIAVYDRTFAGEFFIKAGNANEVIELGELAAVSRCILRLISANAVQHLRGGSFVAGPDHRAPGDSTDANEQADDRDHDHQFDKVKAVLRTGTVSKMHILLAEHSGIYHEKRPVKFQKFRPFASQFATFDAAAAKKVLTSNFDAFGIK